MVTTNPAPTQFSDDWDAEEPTVVDRQPPTPARIPDWNDRTGTWARFHDAAIVAAFANHDDPTVTCRELPAVAA